MASYTSLLILTILFCPPVRCNSASVYTRTNADSEMGIYKRNPWYGIPIGVPGFWVGSILECARKCESTTRTSFEFQDSQCYLINYEQENCDFVKSESGIDFETLKCISGLIHIVEANFQNEDQCQKNATNLIRSHCEGRSNCRLITNNSKYHSRFSCPGGAKLGIQYSCDLQTSCLNRTSTVINSCSKSSRTDEVFRSEMIETGGCSLVRGTATTTDPKFSINLIDATAGNKHLHVDFRFNHPHDTLNYVAFYTQRNGVWSQAAHLPINLLTIIERGRLFSVRVYYESDRFAVYVDGELLHAMKYKLTAGIPNVDTLKLDAMVGETDITF